MFYIKDCHSTAFISVLKWCKHLCRSIFWYLNHFVSVTAGGPESSRAYKTTFYDRLWFIRSVLTESKLFMLKLIEIAILGFITPSLLASACFGTFEASLSFFLTTLFSQGSLIMVMYPKFAYGLYCQLLNPISVDSWRFEGVLNCLTL